MYSTAYSVVIWWGFLTGCLQLRSVYLTRSASMSKTHGTIHFWDWFTATPLCQYCFPVINKALSGDLNNLHVHIKYFHHQSVNNNSYEALIYYIQLIVYIHSIPLKMMWWPMLRDHTSKSHNDMFNLTRWLGW